MSATEQNRRGIPLKVAGSKDLGADKVARNRAQFDGNAPRLRKPLVIYAEDRIDEEELDLGENVLIVDPAEATEALVNRPRVNGNGQGRLF